MIAIISGYTESFYGLARGSCYTSVVLVVVLHGPPAPPAGAPFQPLQPAYVLPQLVEHL